MTPIGIDQDHDAALSALHVPEYVLKIGLVLVLVEEVGDLLSEEFPLKHVFDGEFIGLFDEGDHFF